MAAPASLLFIDTCLFLDVLRCAYRGCIHTNEVSSSLELMEMSKETPPRVWLLTNETVHGEWNKNITNVTTELEREIKKAEAIRKKILAIAELTFGQKFQYGCQEKSLDLHNCLEELSRRLLDNCHLVKIEDSHSVKAMNRVNSGLPPASQHKTEPKDCQIFECFVDVSQQLRQSGFDKQIIFATSNTKDYEENGELKMQDEFNQLNAKYVTNLSWALTEINKA